MVPVLAMPCGTANRVVPFVLLFAWDFPLRKHPTCARPTTTCSIPHALADYHQPHPHLVCSRPALLLHTLFSFLGGDCVRPCPLLFCTVQRFSYVAPYWPCRRRYAACIYRFVYVVTVALHLPVNPFAVTVPQRSAVHRVQLDSVGWFFGWHSPRAFHPARFCQNTAAYPHCQHMARHRTTLPRHTHLRHRL